MLTPLAKDRFFWTLRLPGRPLEKTRHRAGWESCAHSSFGVCALPTCVEKPARVITKKAGAISSDTRICASPRDWCRYRYLPGRRRGRQITDQDWHFQTAPLRDPPILIT